MPLYRTGVGGRHVRLEVETHADPPHIRRLNVFRAIEHVFWKLTEPLAEDQPESKVSYVVTITHDSFGKVKVEANEVVEQRG